MEVPKMVVQGQGTVTNPPVGPQPPITPPADTAPREE